MPKSTEGLACMEVRGGNEPADIGFVLPGLNVHVLARPYRAAAGGGDVHYVSSCGTGRISRLLVADVAGHGDDVADTARVLRDLMRRYINRIDPRLFVSRMNARFAEASHGGEFATAIVATYFAPTRSLSLVNAGHPPPLLYRASARAWGILNDENAGEEIRNVPLGVMSDTIYEQFLVDLEPGDALLCYTDSLPESRDAAGELLGYERLVGLAPELPAEQSSSSWINEWVGRVDAISPGNLLADDLTIVLVRVEGAASRATFRQRLLGAVRLLISPVRGWPPSLPEFSVRNLGGAFLPRLSGSPPHAREQAARKG